MQKRSDCRIRAAQPGDERGAYYVCLKTGNHGDDAEALYLDDPDALGRIYVGPYLAFEPELSLVLDDADGICGYALGAFDSRAFYARYDAEWRPAICAQTPEPTGDPRRWTPSQRVHYVYHHPTYLCPEPYTDYPSHLHIDLLPRAQGRGYGRRLLARNLETLRRRGSAGAHLAVSALNTRAIAFYRHLGFRELTRAGPEDDVSIFMGMRL
jgi:ribosomal protein S18 acetylase RimI-like enzyme